MTNEARPEPAATPPRREIADPSEDLVAREAAEPAEIGRAGTTVPEGGMMSVTGLVRKLVEDVSRLFRKELALATSEIVQSVEETKAGITTLVGGSALMYGGLLFLLGAGAIGLMEVMEPWAAVLVVGAAAFIVGLIMMMSGKRKMSPRSYKPKRAAEALRRDKEMIKRQGREIRNDAREARYGTR